MGDDMKTILLKFSGPLQSWGTSSNFETRHTDFYPSKSAVIGIIAASFGYRRDEDEKISKLNELDFAVRVDQAGNLCRDYHTVKKYKKNGEEERTYVTNRYYLEDFVFVVAISHKDEDFIESVFHALKHPWFQPFMGRRALPLPVDFLLGIFDMGVIDSLKSCVWQAAEWYKRKISSEKFNLEVFADSKLLPLKPSNLRKDCVKSFSQVDRKFAFRYESITNFEIENFMEE